MLRSLSIKNYAIIEEVEFQFHDNLNIITGETGAGKSIVLGALNMVLGARADTKVLYDESKKCVVEADFELSSFVKTALEKEDDFDLDESQLLIRREINNRGKSRSFINDTPVTLNTLRKAGALLLSMHQQFDTLDINNEDVQRSYIDAMSNNSKIREKYNSRYQDYKEIKQELNSLKNQEKQSAQELDYLKHQLTELEQADLDTLELSSLESEFQTLSNAEEIKTVLGTFSQMVSEAENNISDQLTDVSKEMTSLSKINPVIADIKERLDEVNEELLDLQRKSENLAEETEYDELSVQELKDRLDLIYSLQKKHNKLEVNELRLIRDNIRLRIEKNDNLDEHITQLEQRLIRAQQTLDEHAGLLTASRKKSAPGFANSIEKILHKLSMPNAQFEVHFSHLGSYEPHGVDQIDYRFTANKGMSLGSIKEIASGGEMSRLALAIKSILADKTNLPTMIFDEVDSGVSGQVALIMGGLITKLSKKYQIITITHSPQVAAHGDLHFYIFKEDGATRTYTKVKELNPLDRKSQIAEMLSGDPPTPSALTNAQELIDMVSAHKE